MGEKNKVGDTETKETRARWGSHMEFLLASIGLAVGTGNVWRFPYLAQKSGGGAFLLPYCIMLAVEGLPLFYMELGLGQRMQQGSIKVWSQIRPFLKGIGFAQVVVSCSMSIYYPQVMTWCMYYFYLSFKNPLPWIECDKSLIDYSCCMNDSSKYYWYKTTLEATSDIEDNGDLVPGIVICWLIGWLMTYACLFKGPESLGKAAYFTATFPYVVLICLFFRGVTLPGAGEGIKVLFTPDFKKLLDPDVWMDAAGQIFYSLSVGFGALICFGSYNPVKSNCARDSAIISFINCGTSLFAGIVVYAILGYRKTQTGIAVEDTEGGPGLAFITYTTAVAEMPLPQLWAAAFFFMMVMLALNSEFGTIEACITPLKDFTLFSKLPREVLCLLMCCVFFLLGIPMCCRNGLYVFTMWDTYSVAIPLLVVGLVECVAVVHLYGLDRFNADVKYMTGSVPHIYWQMCWKWISPLFIIVVLVAACIKKMIKPPTYSAFVGCEDFPNSVKYPGTANWSTDLSYPAWAQVCAFVMVASPIIFIPVYAAVKWKVPATRIPDLKDMEFEDHANGQVIVNPNKDLESNMQMNKI